MSINDVSICAS